MVNISMANTGKGRKPIKRGAGQRMVDGKNFRLADEVRWKGRYRIEGDAFVYMDRESGRLATIHGYPTHKLIQKG